MSLNFLLYIIYVLQVDDLCSDLEVSLLRLRVPKFHCMYGQRVRTDLQVMADLQLRVYDACRVAVEVLLLASFVKGESAAYASVQRPSVLTIDGIFGIHEGRVFLILVVSRPVASEHDGRPAQQQWEFWLLEAIVERTVEESSRLVCGIIKVLSVVVRGTGREVVCVHCAELESGAPKCDVMV